MKLDSWGQFPHRAEHVLISLTWLQVVSSSLFKFQFKDYLYETFASVGIPEGIIVDLGIFLSLDVFPHFEKPQMRVAAK